MNKNFLGNTGIEVSELSYGSLILGRLQAGLSPKESKPTLTKAVQMGINFFDTAQTYGTHKHLGLGLKSIINDVVISSKTPTRNRKDASRAFGEALKELGREYLDIYQMHLIDSAKDIAARRGVLDFFLELKKVGMIKAVGASVHKVEAAYAVADEPDIDILFPVINSKGMGIIDGGADEMLKACQKAKDNGKGVFAMKPLAGGHLRQSPQEAFDWLRDTGLMDSICTGMKSPAEVEMNVAAFEGRAVSEDVLSRVDTATRHLRIYARCSGCASCIDECDQGALEMDWSQVDEKTGKKGQSVVDQEKCILCGYCAEVCPTFSIRVV